MQVTNRCNPHSWWGRSEAVGVAKVGPEGSTSKLLVRFSNWAPWFLQHTLKLSIGLERNLGWIRRRGDYWILAVGHPTRVGYPWSVVGSPDRKHLWILARTTFMQHDDLLEALKCARSMPLALS